MNYLQATIDRFENGMAVLKFQDGQELAVKKSFLPKEAREGLVINLSFLTDEEATKEKEDLALKILEEILNSKE